MNTQKLNRYIAALMLGGVLSASLPMVAQETQAQRHARAKAQQNAYDKRHHNTAKVVGGSAAGGALIGGLAGGGKGALIGGAAGAGGGLIVDHVRKNRGTKKRERAMTPR